MSRALSRSFRILSLVAAGFVCVSGLARGGSTRVPPTVNYFTPGNGLTGASVTILGANFTNIQSVTFNGVKATYQRISSGKLIATVPTGALTGLITVATNNGSASTSAVFVVGDLAANAPLISSISPARGPSGTYVTITGSGFTGASSVTVGGTAAEFYQDNDGLVTFSVPASAGSGAVAVTTPLGFATSPATFAVGPSPYIRFYSDPSNNPNSVGGTSFWNTPIPSSATTDPNSTSILTTAVLPNTSNANFTNSSVWGISLGTSTSASPVYTVGCTKYDCNTVVTFPIPLGTLPDTGSDMHLVVINPTYLPDGTVNGNAYTPGYVDQELDFWQATYSSRTKTWSGSSRYVNALYGWGACAIPGSGIHCNNGVAAGFDEMGGVVRPEEMQQGHIDHALSVTMTMTLANYIACPATHTDGNSTNGYAIPEGAQIQLDPNFDVDHQPWPVYEKVIAKALQVYGAYISDTGGSIAFYGTNDMNAGNLSWGSVYFGVPETGFDLSSLPWATPSSTSGFSSGSSFRVLKITSCN